jgi:hypothetical protein
MKGHGRYGKVEPGVGKLDLLEAAGTDLDVAAREGVPEVRDQGGIGLDRDDVRTE